VGFVVDLCIERVVGGPTRASYQRCEIYELCLVKRLGGAEGIVVWIERGIVK
jgi:hypothetical protein